MDVAMNWYSHYSSYYYPVKVRSIQGCNPFLVKSENLLYDKAYDVLPQFGLEEMKFTNSRQFEPQELAGVFKRGPKRKRSTYYQSDGEVCRPWNKALKPVKGSLKALDFCIKSTLYANPRSSDLYDEDDESYCDERGEVYFSYDFNVEFIGSLASFTKLGHLRTSQFSPVGESTKVRLKTLLPPSLETLIFTDLIPSRGVDERMKSNLLELTCERSESVLNLKRLELEGLGRSEGYVKDLEDLKAMCEVVGIDLIVNGEPLSQIPAPSHIFVCWGMPLPPARQ